MMKKQIISLTVVFFLATLTSFASRKDEVTLLLIPREDETVRVGMDIANRYPTLLLSYKTNVNGKVSLHGWSGKEWVNISLEDFHEGNFFRVGPDSALVVEVEGVAIPEVIIPPVDWCKAAYKITTTEIRPLVHLAGQYYDFKHKDWTWFSENHQLPMDALNPEGLNVAWYHKRLNEHLKKHDPVAAGDLQYWVAIRHPQSTEAEEEIISTNETEVIENSEQPEVEVTEEFDENPLTNAVPEAVVLGAGDAEEAKVDDLGKTQESE